MGEPGLGPYLWLVPVSILGAGLYQVFNCWAIRKGGYDRIARTQVTQSLTQLTLQVGVGRPGQGPRWACWWGTRWGAPTAPAPWPCWTGAATGPASGG